METVAGYVFGPEGEFIDEFTASRVAGTALEGTYRGDLTLPLNAPPGTYSIDYWVDDVSARLTYISFTAPTIPAAVQTTFRVQTPAPIDAYSTWRNQRTSLSGGDGGPWGDPDGDGLPNAFEFLCGTDPSLFSGIGGSDPEASRAPVFEPTPTALRLHFKLSTSNPSLGTGTSWHIVGQVSSDPLQKESWVDTPLLHDSMADSYYVETPRDEVPTKFFRLAVRP